MGLAKKYPLTIGYLSAWGVMIVLILLELPDMPDQFLGLPGPLIWVGIFGLALGGGMIFHLLDLRKKQNRTIDLKLLAHGRGWKYHQYLDLPFLQDIADRLKQNVNHPLRSKFIEGIAGKINGWDFVAFDGEIDDGETVTWKTVFALHIKGAELPLFGLEPETLSSRLHDKLAGFDIDFQSHPDFSKDYTLYGDSEDQVRSLFSDEVLNYFQDRPPHSVFAHHDHLVIYGKKQTELLEYELEKAVQTANILRENNIKPVAKNKYLEEVRETQKESVNRTDSGDGIVTYW